MPPLATFWGRLRGDLAGLEQWLLPGECLLCLTKVGAADPLVCGVCRSRWQRVPAPACDRCGQPAVPGVPCRICPEWPRVLVKVRSGVWLDRSARRAIHLFKYEGWLRLADAMADAMRPLAGSTAGATLVPVPLGPARERTRGYNQSAVLANALGRRWGVPVRGVLRRSRDTATQTRLTPEGRAANVRGAFTAVQPGPARAVLVDDVFTTGATLAAAARALEAAGSNEVLALTFARAELPLAPLARAG